MKNEKIVVRICFSAFFVNLILFFTKLYISLSANSISIFSDGINNLADSMSCILSGVFVLAAVSINKKEPEFTIGKAEQILSFVLSVIVFAVGAGFAYSSAERLMYPTPIWFSSVYFAVILVTAVVKAGMFVVLRCFEKKTNSAVLAVMKTDSLMDAAITMVTLISFTVTRYTDFTVDAFAGIAISIFIIAESAVLVRQSLFGLLNIVSAKDRSVLKNEIINNSDFKIIKIEYNVVSQDEKYAYVFLNLDEKQTLCDVSEMFADIKSNIFEKTGIKALLVINEDIEKQEA